MTIQGKLGSVSYDDERARAHGHDPVILSGKVKAGQGQLPVGLILSRDGNGEFIPYAEAADEVIATGNGSTTDYEATLAHVPVEPGTVSITDGVETFADDGHGHLTGDAGGTGTVTYGTGAVSVSFNTAVGDGTNVTAAYVTAIDGVLDETVDTAKTASATYIPHGSVRRDALKVGATDPADPDATLLSRLTARGIYPMG